VHTVSAPCTQGQWQAEPWAKSNTGRACAHPPSLLVLISLILVRSLDPDPLQERAGAQALDDNTPRSGGALAKRGAEPGPPLGQHSHTTTSLDNGAPTPRLATRHGHSPFNYIIYYTGTYIYIYIQYFRRPSLVNNNNIQQSTIQCCMDASTQMYEYT